MLTKHNPGAFAIRSKTRLTYFVKHILKSFRDGDFLGAVNYVLSESINIWNDRIAIFKLGNTFQCSVCTYKGKFAHKSNRLGIAWNSICPNCDSRSRHRGLFIYLPKNHSERSKHFAPEPILSQLFLDNKSYKTTDFFLADVDFPNEDIQSLTLESEKFDWVLCNHVLEHVPDDSKAIENIARVLKKNGNAIITIPGNFGRQKTVLFKDLVLNGHFRDYGLDVIEKLEIYFSSVSLVRLSDQSSVSFAIRKNEVAFICKK